MICGKAALFNGKVSALCMDQCQQAKLVIGKFFIREQDTCFSGKEPQGEHMRYYHLLALFVTVYIGKKKKKTRRIKDKKNLRH